MTLGEQDNVDALLDSYRRHVELAEVEVERLASVLRIKPLYLMCWYYWQSVATGYQPSGGEGWWNYTTPKGIEAMVSAVDRALNR